MDTKRFVYPKKKKRRTKTETTTSQPFEPSNEPEPEPDWPEHTRSTSKGTYFTFHKWFCSVSLDHSHSILCSKSDYIICDQKEYQTIQYINDSAYDKIMVDYGNYAVPNKELHCLLHPQEWLNSEVRTYFGCHPLFFLKNSHPVL